MDKVNRRTFVCSSLAAAFSLAPSGSGQATAPLPQIETRSAAGPDIIDTNVNLLEFPFRRLKYGNTRSLAGKLKKHRVKQAWAGSFEALLHKNVDGVNGRLTEECRNNGEGMLLPFGTVNLAWPDWEDDLRRCHEVYKMSGVRLYPTYQSFDLDHQGFLRFLELAGERKLIVQIVGDMEDSRTIHPIVQVRSMNTDALTDALKKIPSTKVQLLYWNHKAEGKKLDRLITETNVSFDTSRMESTGAIGRMIAGNPWAGFGTTTPLAAERLLFGSHAPYFPLEANILKLFESPLTLEQMQAIMVNNAQRLWKKS
ncbi:MAG: amidohydrolase family protein [Cyclobacteriaceae bacterium]